LLNYLGVVITIISAIILLFVKVETNNVGDSNSCLETNTSHEITTETDPIIETTNEKEEKDIFDKMTKIQKRIIGTILSFFAGICYGFAYMPGLYIQDNYPNASKNNNDYAFSLSTGIFLSSAMYFLIYCLCTKNKPKIYPEIILPSFATGWIWGTHS
jgi:hypothetical protein